MAEFNRNLIDAIEQGLLLEQGERGASARAVFEHVTNWKLTTVQYYLAELERYGYLKSEKVRPVGFGFDVNHYSIIKPLEGYIEMRQRDGRREPKPKKDRWHDAKDRIKFALPLMTTPSGESLYTMR